MHVLIKSEIQTREFVPIKIFEAYHVDLFSENHINYIYDFA